MATSRFRVPHTLVLIFGMIVVALVLTYVLPQGQFERVDHDGHEVVVPGSYARATAPVLLAPYRLFTAIPKGFAEAQGVIFFVLIIGGAFGIFRATGAADALIGFLLDRMGGAPSLLIAGGMLTFAAGSSTIGMAEEYLPFVPVLLVLCIGLGFDAVTAVGIMCVGYAVGYGSAIINPFTVFIAQEIAGLDQGSGMAFRLALCALFLAIGYRHVARYARRVRADPSSSLVADLPPVAEAPRERTPLSGRHLVCLGVIVVGVLVLIYGLKFEGWYLVEMGALFSAIGLILGLVGGLGLDKTAREFCTGATELTTTALLIGFARTIQVVLDEGQIVDTIINGIAQPLAQLGPHLAAAGMFGVQSLCNLFIPSGSGQAYVTMPIMAPLSDLLGVSRQVSVLAYQFGDGFTNIVVPTNPVLIGILAMAKIPYDRWLRFVLPFMIQIWIVGSLALILAVMIGYQ